MNATPMNLNSAPAVQAPSQAGKQADAAAADVPFSQMLSGEIAQARKTDDARQGSEGSTGAGPAAKAASQADAPADAAAPAKPGKDDAHDRHATTAEEAAAAGVPAALLALAINPDAFKPAAAAATPAGTAAATEAAAAPGADAVSRLDSRKGRASPSFQAAQLTGDARGAQKPAPAVAGKADAVDSAKPAAVAAAADPAPPFAERLAAALQTDTAKQESLPADLLGNPALRAAAHAPLAAQFATAEAASPRLAPTVGTTAWGHALGEKLVWMASGSQQSASLTLNPPNLGPLQIVLHVTNDQATASFFSAQPEVRQ